jgi:hypothetical protein
MWGVGYIATPVLFRMLSERIVAGNIAGQLFTYIAWIGVGTAVYVLALMAVKQGRAVLRRALFWGVVAMLACVVAGLGIQAEMVALKAGVVSMDVMESAARGQFMMLHGVSSTIYLVQSLLGVWLAVGCDANRFVWR